MRMEHRAPQVRRVWMKKLRMESDGRFRPAHRHGPGRPVPQGAGARAAIEREDRTAISERVPCGLPRTRGNRSRGGVQACRNIPHTTRILEAVRGLSVPVTQEERRHTFPTAAGFLRTPVPAPLEEERGALSTAARATASRVPAQACGMRMHVPGQQRRWMRSGGQGAGRAPMKEAVRDGMCSRIRADAVQNEAGRATKEERAAPPGDGATRARMVHAATHLMPSSA